MGTVITVTSGKGGTGKTTVTGGVASCLARLGKTVLCIDMDIGLRNLDISLGLSDRALMDFADGALGNCPLARAAVSHPDLPNLSLLTAPMRLPPHVTAGSIRALLRTARDRYDYIFIDCPAGLGPGFQLATCGAARALLVATNDASSLRDAQRAAVPPEPGPSGDEPHPAQAAAGAAHHHRRRHGRRRTAPHRGDPRGPAGHSGRQHGPPPDSGGPPGGRKRLSEYCQTN